MVKAQEYLSNNYPLDKRKDIKELNLSNNDLEGQLNLSGFSSLKKLDCSHNQIISLDLTDNSKSLEELVANDNQLSRLIFDTSDPTKLKTLNLANNKFHNNHNFWNFTFLFRNLNYLDLRNSGIKQGLVDDISYIEKVSLDDGEWKRQVSSEKEKREHNLANYLKENPGREEDYYQAQTWLDFNYPTEERSKVEEIMINGYWEWARLKGNLDLRDFTNLRKLNIQFNWGITGCDITGLHNLTFLCVCQTQVKEINFSDSKDKLTEIYFNDCDFSEQGLDMFQDLPKLQHLQIRNYFREPEKQKQFRNRFKGSLKPLRTSPKLEELHINNTDLDSGLEYLPESLEVIYCNNNKRPEALCENLQRQLESYNEGNIFYDYQAWRKNNQETIDEIDAISVQEWLESNYPLHRESKRKRDKENVGKNRKEITKLDISDKKLKGSLNLEGFTSLKELDCSGNFLTNLELSSCSELINLDCSKNRFTNSNFLKSLPNKDKLEKLNLQKSIRLPNGEKIELDFLTPFTELVELNVEDCPFEGSLSPLRGMKKLRKIFISHTDLKEGIEDLPESCKNIYCDFNYKSKSKSVIIARELGKHLEMGDDIKYYDLNKWKYEQRSGIASVIPLERLYVIRGNMKKFFDKWGGGEENKKWWKLWEKSGNDKLGKLWTPEEFNKNWWLITGVQWTNRAASVIGGSLLLVGTSRGDDQYTETGGVIAIVAPFIEVVTSQISDKIYETREQQWEEFERDVENLWDNFYELVGILEPVKDSFQGKAKVDEALSDLNDAVYSFLKEYDKNNDKKVDINEMEETRKELIKDLIKKWEKKEDEEHSGKKIKLSKIIQETRKLEEEVIKYRKAFYRWVREKEAEETKKREEAENNPDTAIDMDEKEQVEENDSIIEIQPKNY